MRTPMTRWMPGGALVGAGMVPSDTVRMGQWVPALDMTETEQAFVVSLEVPGMAPEDLDVVFEAGSLVIRGEKRGEREQHEGSYHRVERTFGRFERAVRINLPVDAEQVAADYHDGVLTVRLPKAPQAQPKRVSVSGGEAPLTVTPTGEEDK